MIEININREISAPLNQVWDIISNMDSEPRYWRGLHAIYGVRKKGNVIEREIKVGFRDLKGRQIVVVYPKKSLEVTFTEGPMIGTRTITLIPSSSNNEEKTTTTRVYVSWNIKLSNIPLLFRGIVRERIAEATEEALDRITRSVQ